MHEDIKKTKFKKNKEKKLNIFYFYDYFIFFDVKNKIFYITNKVILCT